MQQDLTFEEAEKLLEDANKEFAQICEDSDNVYMSVISQLNIDHSDEKFVEEIFEMLNRRTRDFLILSVWKHMTEEQSKELQTYLEKMFTERPDEDEDNLILEFAFANRDLVEKVCAGLSDFFEDFIKKFNRYYEA